MSLYFSKHRGAGFVNDGVDLLDDIEIGFVVGVADATATPGYGRQLAHGQNGANAASKST